MCPIKLPLLSPTTVPTHLPDPIKAIRSYAKRSRGGCQRSSLCPTTAWVTDPLPLSQRHSGVTSFLSRRLTTNGKENSYQGKRSYRVLVLWSSGGFMNAALFPCTEVTADNRVFFGELWTLYTAVTHWWHGGHDHCGIPCCNSLTEEEKIESN